MNLNNEKISSGVAEILLGQSIFFAVSSLVYSFILFFIMLLFAQFLKFANKLITYFNKWLDNEN